MDKQYIESFVKEIGDKWYYPFDFDDVVVKPNLMKKDSEGLKNWSRLKPIMSDLFSKVDNPHVFDIGCNMALYGHEMTKMGSKVTGVDRNLKTANFYKRYVTENLNEQWLVNMTELDVLKESFRDETVNIVTLFCVIYHLHDNEKVILEKIKEWFPNLKYVVVQANEPRVKKRKQPLSGLKGIQGLLTSTNYEIETHAWDGYPKPVVVGKNV